MSDDFENSPARMREEDARHTREGRLIGALIVLLSAAFAAWVMFEGYRP